MHPTINHQQIYATVDHQIARDRVADLHRRAQHYALARAARQGRPHKRPSGRHALRLPIIAVRRALTA
jgi:hypothetical protein